MNNGESSRLAAHVKGISKSFGDGGARLQVLKEIDLEVRRGDITMLVGPSGCGKTTLISIIAGTLKADAGELTVLGHDLRKMSTAAITRFRSKHIGFIFQSFNLIPTLTCAENVSVPLLIQGVGASKAEKRAKEVLDQVGLADRFKHRPSQLSGGQQQRVAIARALVQEPPLVLADEPTGNLDTASSDEVFVQLRRMHAELGTSFVVVTHDPRLAARCDRLVELVDGRIARDEAIVHAPG